MRTLVQKLRAGEQFLARGRVLQIADASGTDVMQFELVAFAKLLILHDFLPNPIRTIVQKIPDTHSGIWNFLYTVEEYPIFL